jgi:hypothetical protein
LKITTTVFESHTQRLDKRRLRKCGRKIWEDVVKE